MKRILVPLDRSELAERALHVAVMLAARQGATLRLVQAWPAYVADGGALPTAMTAALDDQRDAAAYLETLSSDVRARTGVRVETALLTPPAAPAICRDARDAGVDLIVMATHGRTGWSRVWIGSVADAVIRATPTPVLLVRARDEGAERATKFERVLVPLDGTANAERILAVVASLFDAVPVHVRLLRVLQQVRTVIVMPEGGIPVTDVDEQATTEAVAQAEQYVAEVGAKLRADLPHAEVEWSVQVHDAIARAVLHAAQDVDLVAMVPRRHGVGRLLLGSVTDKVLRGTQASLLVTHQEPDVGDAASREEATHR